MNTKRNLSFLLIAAALLGCSHLAMASDKVVKREIKVKNFIRIALLNSSSVYYTQGAKTSVVAVGPQEDIDRLNIHSDGSTLEIRSERRRSINIFRGWNSDDVKIYVTSPDIVGISVKGSGDFVAKNKIDTDAMTVELYGSGDIDIFDIICNEIKTTLKGSGDIDIDRLRCASSGVWLTGSGDIKMRQIGVKNTYLSLVGSGDVSISFHECGSVKANLTGSGDITLSGSIKQLDKTKRGSGDYHTSHLNVGR